VGAGWRDRAFGWSRSAEDADASVYGPGNRLGVGRGGGRLWIVGAGRPVCGNVSIRMGSCLGRGLVREGRGLRTHQGVLRGGAGQREWRGGVGLAGTKLEPRCLARPRLTPVPACGLRRAADKAPGAAGPEQGPRSVPPPPPRLLLPSIDYSPLFVDTNPCPPFSPPPSISPSFRPRRPLPSSPLSLKAGARRRDVDRAGGPGAPGGRLQPHPQGPADPPGPPPPLPFLHSPRPRGRLSLSMAVLPTRRCRDAGSAATLQERCPPSPPFPPSPQIRTPEIRTDAACAS
jgi:hypothetical protein